MAEKLGLTVEYIYHSGFTVETEKDFLVFDYYHGTINLPSEKNVKVFSSHAHPDHFNPQIFEWASRVPNLHFYLSSDIRNYSALPQSLNKITFLDPYEEVAQDDLTIRTYGSTDAGVSFLLELNHHKQPKPIRVFHAGDLNWWHWWGEPPADRQLAEQLFKAEMAKIKGEHIDLAFFPVDPRLEQYYGLGAEYFIQEIKPDILIPMHFMDDYAVLQEFAQKMSSSSTKVLTIKHENERFEL